MPLIAETLLLCALAFLIGLGVSALLFKPRRPADSYLGEE